MLLNGYWLMGDIKALKKSFPAELVLTLFASSGFLIPYDTLGFSYRH
jgi:hypothetical protein